MRKTTKFCDICGISSDEKIVNYSKKFNMFLCKKTYASVYKIWT